MTTTTAPALPNVRMNTSTVVHRGAMRKYFGIRDRQLAPRCMSGQQLDRVRSFGSPVETEVTCTKAKCQG